MIWRIMDISEDIIRQGTSALAINTILDLYNSSYHTQHYPIIVNTFFLTFTHILLGIFRLVFPISCLIFCTAKYIWHLNKVRMLCYVVWCYVMLCYVQSGGQFTGRIKKLNSILSLHCIRSFRSGWGRTSVLQSRTWIWFSDARQ